MIPKDACVLISGICDPVSLCGKGEWHCAWNWGCSSANLNIRDDHGWSEWGPVSSQESLSVEDGGWRGQNSAAWGLALTLLALKMEEEPQAKECGWPIEAGQSQSGERKEKKQQQGNGCSPWASRKAGSPVDNLILAWWTSARLLAYRIARC